MTPAPDISTRQARQGARSSDQPLRERFLKWQCRSRQMAMRENQGRPDAAITPEIILLGGPDPSGRITTVLNKSPAHSMTPELLHMARKTNDPARTRSEAIEFFSATYFQNHRSFSDLLTAVFPHRSPGAAKIRNAQSCNLVFEAYGQRFDLSCRVWKLARANPYFAATLAHNRLFSPDLPPDPVVLGFEPDWADCSCETAGG